MKLPKLAIKLPSSLRRLRAPKRLAGGGSTSEVDSGAVTRTTLVAPKVQSSPIFLLPDELFLDILEHFPVLRWSDLFYRYSHTWYTPIPNVYGERAHVLSTLSATCRAMRYRFLPVVWERSLMCLKRWRQSNQIPARLRLQCRTLMGDCSLAAYVRSMTVDLACDGTEAILETFVKCLTVLPNLHTLEVTSFGTKYSQPLRKALDGIELPQIRTLVLPSMAHCLLPHCPNLDDLTCTPFCPDEGFIESLTAGKQKLRRFAVLFPGDTTAWTELARVCPDISELSVVFWDNIPSDTRDCIATLTNLSTLQIIYLVPFHNVIPICNQGFSLEVLQEQARHRTAFREKMEKNSEDRWNEMKQMAIEHLKSCSGSGPKVLRTIMLDHDGTSGMHFDSAARTEEVQIEPE